MTRVRAGMLGLIVAHLCCFVLMGCEDGNKSDKDGGTDTETNTDTDSHAPVDCSDDPIASGWCPGEYPELDCTVYVDGDVEQSGDGWSWATAVRSVQEGIDLAHCGAVEHGVCEQWQVWVKQGIYYVFDGKREDTVCLREQVGVFGGFDGSETQLAERDCEANVTTLDGREGPSGETNVFHVVTGADDSTLDGVTVTAGLADSDEDEFAGLGGGMFNYYASPYIENCVFENNSATNGGGIWFEHSSPVIENCEFRSNQAIAGSGGAIGGYSGGLAAIGCTFTENTASLGGGAILTRGVVGSISGPGCSFVGNTADGHGGGVDLHESEVTVTGCEFEGNGSEVGAGMIAGESSTAEVYDCHFEANTASYYGGGLYVGLSTATVEGCQFTGNQSEYIGGGIGLNYSSAFVSSTVLEGNEAQWGGGVQSQLSEPVFENCVFTGNSAEVGGGGALIVGAATITNCTMFANTSVGGASIEALSDSDCEFGTTSVANSILRSGSSSGELIYKPYSCPPTIRYCNVQGGFDGEGNIDLDPMFLDEASGDLHLSEGSPCIDAADGDVAPINDFEGNPRVDDLLVSNTGAGDPPYSDIGAFEYQP